MTIKCQCVSESVEMASEMSKYILSLLLDYTVGQANRDIVFDHAKEKNNYIKLNQINNPFTYIKTC